MVMIHLFIFISSASNIYYLYIAVCVLSVCIRPSTRDADTGGQTKPAETIQKGF